MTFSFLPALKSFIRRTHSYFGGVNIKYVDFVLRNVKASFEADPALCGITYEARTNADHGNVKTLCTIERTKDGAWILTERTA